MVPREIRTPAVKPSHPIDAQRDTLPKAVMDSSQIAPTSICLLYTSDIVIAHLADCNLIVAFLELYICRIEKIL